MDGGLTLGQGLHSGFSGLTTLVFQWVPSVLLSLSSTGDSVLTAPLGTPLQSATTVGDVADYIQHFSTPETYQSFIINWGIFTALSIFVSLILVCILAYCIVRLLQVRRFEAARFYAIAHPVSARNVPKTHMRWERIVAEINSDSDKNWRLAILEADIMLNELLDMQGYRGETLADKLRGVDRTRFNSIDVAWEAHRTRNKIAHESSDTPLDPREARQALSLYSKVFREFKVIE